MRAPWHAASESPRSPGQPPRHSCTAASCRDRPGFWQLSNPPCNRFCRETSPVEIPVSSRVMVRNRSREMRPAPVGRVMSSAGAAEPVRMNCPRFVPLSTARRTWFHSNGSICHSSISRGLSPANTRDGSTAAARRAFSSTSSNTSLAATSRAMAVLPQALGPSISAGGLQSAGKLPVPDSRDICALHDGVSFIRAGRPVN